MAWEKRLGRQRYLYVAQRIEGRVVKEYVGRGPVADVIAQLRRLQQAEREEAETTVKLERHRYAAARRAIAELMAW